MKFLKLGVLNNPYKNAPSTQKLANMHCHPYGPHGWGKAHELIDAYSNAGYDILTVSPHSGKKRQYSDVNELIPYPWDNLSTIQDGAENRSADALNMLSIPGTEIEYPNHISSYFSMFDNDFHRSHDTLLQGVTDAGGLSQYNHPHDLKYTDMTVRDFVYYFNKYPVLIGIEVRNKVEDKAEDEALWDTILEKTMPHRTNVYGMGNDDAHASSSLGRSWMRVFVNSIEYEDVKDAFKKGRFYSCSAHGTRGYPATVNYPIINKIYEVSKNKLKVNSQYADDFQWITMGGRIISTTDTVDMTEANKYVRLKINNSYGEALSNAIGYESITFL